MIVLLALDFFFFFVLVLFFSILCNLFLADETNCWVLRANEIKINMPSWWDLIGGRSSIQCNREGEREKSNWLPLISVRSIFVYFHLVGLPIVRPHCIVRERRCARRDRHPPAAKRSHWLWSTKLRTLRLYALKKRSLTHSHKECACGILISFSLSLLLLVRPFFFGLLCFFF